MQQITGHSKLGPKDKAKEAAEKAKGQKSKDANSEGSFLDFFCLHYWNLLTFGLWSLQQPLWPYPWACSRAYYGQPFAARPASNKSLIK